MLRIKISFAILSLMIFSLACSLSAGTDAAQENPPSPIEPTEEVQESPVNNPAEPTVEFTQTTEPTPTLEPTSTPSPTQTPTEAPITAEVVTSADSLKDGIFQVIGIVQNTSPVAINQISILIKFYDQDGVLVNRMDAYPYLHVVGPGETTPFSVIAIGERIPTGWVSYEFTITAIKQDKLSSNHNVLVVKNLVSSDSPYAGQHMIFGELENTGTLPARMPQIFVAIFDNKENLRDVTYCTLLEANSIPSGEAEIFSCPTIFASNNPELGRYEFWSEGDFSLSGF